MSLSRWNYGMDFAWYGIWFKWCRICYTQMKRTKTFPMSSRLPLPMMLFCLLPPVEISIVIISLLLAQTPSGPSRHASDHFQSVFCEQRSQNQPIELFKVFHETLCIDRSDESGKKCHMFFTCVCAAISNSLNYTCLLSAHFSSAFLHFAHRRGEKKLYFQY